jgi:hypothetical protein
MAELASKSCSCIVSCSGFDRKYRLSDSKRHLAAAGEISNQEQKIYIWAESITNPIKSFYEQDAVKVNSYSCKFSPHAHHSPRAKTETGSTPTRQNRLAAAASLSLSVIHLIKSESFCMLNRGIVHSRARATRVSARKLRAALFWQRHCLLAHWLSCRFCRRKRCTPVCLFLKMPARAY